jgi:hypothetical protein
LAGSLIQSLVTANTTDKVLSALAALCCGTLIYRIIHKPRLEIADEGVKIINPLSTVFLPWSEVINIETQFALTFYTAERKVSSWAAIAPGRYHHRSIHPTEVKGVIPRDSRLLRASDSPRTDSGAAAYIARMRWEKFNKSH